MKPIVVGKTYNNKKRRKEEAERWIANITADNAKQEKLIEKLKKELESINKHECYACGQEIHDNKQEEIRKQKEEMLQESALQILSNQTQEQEHQDVLKEIGELENCPVTEYDHLEQALNHKKHR